MQRGSGKRSLLYSALTFGLWYPCADGEALIAVGKSYFGFTDEKLVMLDRYARSASSQRPPARP